jgi:hypothetical protein
MNGAATRIVKSARLLWQPGGAVIWQTTGP